MDLQTIALHAGYEKDSSRTMAVPIYQTTAYDFGTAEFAASSFNLEQGTDHVYTRVGNPTNAILERRFAEVEGGSACLAVASGMAAIFYSVLNVAESGDNIVVSNQLYGGTITLFNQTLKKLGIEARFFDIHSPEKIESLIDDKTRCIFFEAISNPSIDVPDFDEIIKISNKYNILTVVDNTVATPILFQPLLLGADIVIHSASKYTTGQGTALGGFIVERKDLSHKIKGNRRYPYFNEPELSYNGLVFADSVVSGMLFTFRARMILLRDTGAVISPFNSWLLIQGLETLSLRMREHSKNALLFAEFLESHPKVKKVNYPGLKSNANYKNAQKYFQDGACSGLLSFEIENLEIAKNILDKVTIFSIVANIGDSKSIITHPASTTHQQLKEKELEACGVPAGLIRISCGLENIADLIADMKQALEA
ncbi:O-acetylhomoserine aminocarboxypropyltransferase/cysteine synthase family protein [Sulfurimonas sp.]|uniref:O-acetylhomoserine aminocarboxypropyltransferase/cysteine synthase family protein n=1 Tax=Sulfurimonas sp. TaxID=2022749 RepID=UPI0025FFDF08|nr:O-acetylhomoserine aminocarboxypropyltransferase/cysteine synthase family protein [Sulfurimonas sp.]MDD5157216.1 O-acetylhomoserine aminocarboxypropyltransferase/cysteine synthase [Sulfurimonas sp.]